MPVWQPCDAPHAGHRLDLEGDAVWLTLPDRPDQVFCSLHCLAIWAAHHAQTSFREIRREGVMVEVED